MPQVHFVGEITSCHLPENTSISVSWAVVPGNFSWFLKAGDNAGETQSHIFSQIHSVPNHTGNILNHPLDIYYETASTEGWPFFVCEVWDRQYSDYRSFLGCGSVWLPASGANLTVDIALWRPTSSGLDKLTEMMMPSLPDLQALRELVICPYQRSEIQTASVGKLRLSLTVVTSGLKENGVQLWMIFAFSIAKNDFFCGHGVRDGANECL